jgi:hypothetical protein
MVLLIVLMKLLTQNNNLIEPNVLRIYAVLTIT